MTFNRVLTATLLVLLLGCGNASAPERVHTAAAKAPSTTLTSVSSTTSTTAPPTTTTAPPPTAPPTTAPRPSQVRTASVAAVPAPQPSRTEPPDSDFDRLSGCESGHRWNLNSGNGYYGGLQFDKGTWNAYAAPGKADGSPYPGRADWASREDQIEVARRVWRARGWAPWPSCSRQVGLR